MIICVQVKAYTDTTDMKWGNGHVTCNILCIAPLHLMPVSLKETAEAPVHIT